MVGREDPVAVAVRRNWLHVCSTVPHPLASSVSIPVVSHLRTTDLVRTERRQL